MAKKPLTAEEKKAKIKALPKKISSADIKPAKKKNLKKSLTAEEKKAKIKALPKKISSADIKPAKKKNLKVEKKKPPTTGKPSAKSQAMMDKLKKEKAPKKKAPKKGKPSAKSQAMMDKLKKEKTPKKEAPKKEAPKKEAPKKKGKSKTIQTLKPIERNQLAGLLVKNFKLPLNRRFYDDERIKEELQTLYQKPNNWIDTPIMKLDSEKINKEKRRILEPPEGNYAEFQDRGLDHQPPLGRGSVDLKSMDDDEGRFQRRLNEEYYEPNTIIRNWKDYLAFLHIKEDDFTRDVEKIKFRYIERTGNNLNTRLNNSMKDIGVTTSWKYMKNYTQPGDKAMKTFIDNYLANPPEINPNNLDETSRYKLKKKFIMEEGTNKIDVIYKNQTLKMNAKEIITFVNNISGYKNLSKGQIEKLYKLFMYEPSYKLDFHTDVKAKTTLLKKLNIQEGNKLVITPSFKFNENDEDAKAISSYEIDVAVLKIELKKE